MAYTVKSNRGGEKLVDDLNYVYRLDRNTVEKRIGNVRIKTAKLEYILFWKKIFYQFVKQYLSIYFTQYTSKNISSLFDGTEQKN